MFGTAVGNYADYPELSESANNLFQILLSNFKKLSNFFLTVKPLGFPFMKSIINWAYNCSYRLPATGYGSAGLPPERYKLLVSARRRPSVAADADVGL